MNKKSDDANEDKTLWSFITRTVKPLKNRDDPVCNEINDTPLPASDELNNEEENIYTSTIAGYRDSTASEVRSQTGGTGPRSREIDKKSLQKLKRGQYKIEGRLDLHGMTQVNARDALINFLQASYQQGKRCVLVITGKGLKAIEDESGYLLHQEKGVLKKNLPSWLNDPPCSEVVLQYCQAQPKHGGGGAFYILLRRKR